MTEKMVMEMVMEMEMEMETVMVMVMEMEMEMVMVITRLNRVQFSQRMFEHSAQRVSLNLHGILHRRWLVEQHGQKGIEEEEFVVA